MNGFQTVIANTTIDSNEVDGNARITESGNNTACGGGLANFVTSTIAPYKGTHLKLVNSTVFGNKVIVSATASGSLKSNVYPLPVKAYNSQIQ